MRPATRATIISFVILVIGLTISVTCGVFEAAPWKTLSPSDWRYREQIGYGVIGGLFYGGPASLIVAVLVGASIYRSSRKSPN
jgi:hypothetical protein